MTLSFIPLTAFVLLSCLIINPALVHAVPSPLFPWPDTAITSGDPDEGKIDFVLFSHQALASRPTADFKGPLEPKKSKSAEMRRAASVRFSGQAPDQSRQSLANAASMQRLFQAWAAGVRQRNRMVYEARRLGFQGVCLWDNKKYPLPASAEISVGAPYSRVRQDRLLTYLIENLWSHGSDRGYYFWRETGQGYEFLILDYGRGALNPLAKPQQSLLKIFHSHSYDKGKVFHRMAGAGNGLHIVGAYADVARAISMNGGSIKVVDKIPGQRFEGWRKKIPSRQSTLSMAEAQVSGRIHGFAVHGFLPWFGS